MNRSWEQLFIGYKQSAKKRALNGACCWCMQVKGEVSPCVGSSLVSHHFSQSNSAKQYSSHPRSREGTKLKTLRIRISAVRPRCLDRLHRSLALLLVAMLLRIFYELLSKIGLPSWQIKICQSTLDGWTCSNCWTLSETRIWSKDNQISWRK